MAYAKAQADAAQPERVLLRGVNGSARVLAGSSAMLI